MSHARAFRAEQAALFLLDPCGNALALKAVAVRSKLCAQ